MKRKGEPKIIDERRQVLLRYFDFSYVFVKTGLDLMAVAYSLSQCRLLASNIHRWGGYVSINILVDWAFIYALLT